MKTKKKKEVEIDTPTENWKFSKSVAKTHSSSPMVTIQRVDIIHMVTNEQEQTNQVEKEATISTDALVRRSNL